MSGSGRSLVYLSASTHIRGSAPEIHVRMIVKGLRRLGWGVTLVSPPVHSKHPGMMSRVREILGVNLRFADAVWAADAAYFRLDLGILPGFELARLLRKPRVMEVNGPAGDLQAVYGWTRPLGSMARWLFAHMIKKSSLAIVPTEGLERYVRSLTPVQGTVVVPNGVDPVTFQPDLTPPTRIVPGRYALFFGTFAEWQGIPTMLAATESQHWPDGVSLVFAGDGSQESFVAAAAAESEHIEYVGRLGQPELRRTISRALCTLSTQHLTGDRVSIGVSPLKVYESLACETPVIVSCRSEVSEIVQESNSGFCVPWGDPDALALAVAEVNESSELSTQMGRNGRALILESHTWEHRSERTHATMVSHLGFTPD